MGLTRKNIIICIVYLDLYHGDLVAKPSVHSEGVKRDLIVQFSRNVWPISDVLCVGRASTPLRRTPAMIA